MASALNDLVKGFASTISGSGIATYRSDGSAYLASETAITFYDMPPSPDRCIVLTPVPMTDGTVVPYGIVLVQVKMRGLPNQALDTNDLGDAVFDLMHGATNMVFGGTHAIQILRNSSIPMGIDSARRWLRTDHYYVDLDYAATANRPAGGWD